MSDWGNKDAKIETSNTQIGSITVSSGNSTVIGVDTTLTDFNVGDFLFVGDNNYVITSIANDTVATVETADGAGVTISGASSNSDYVVSEKPMYIKYSMNIDANNVYGVDTTEMAYANTADTENEGIAHAGWVLRTVGTGGRAGRVQYETLVAGSSITGDAPDDATLPEEN